MNFLPPPFKMKRDVCTESGEGMRGKKKKKSLARVIWGWLFFILLLIILVLTGIYLSGQQMKITGSAMYPTLSDQDTVIVDRISYHFRRPRRFDIVVFPFEFQENTSSVRRVIALPGETVQISEGRIYVNGQLLEEPETFDLIEQPGLASTTVTLNEDEYFVLGDNRNNSSDSRDPTLGSIRREDIEGRVWMRTAPLLKFGLVH